MKRLILTGLLITLILAIVQVLIFKHIKQDVARHVLDEVSGQTHRLDDERNTIIIDTINAHIA